MGKTITINNCLYYVDEKQAVLLSWQGSLVSNGNAIKVLEVPTLVEKVPVREIAPNAFQNANIISVELPATIQIIGERAFVGSLIEKIVFYASSIHPYSDEIAIGQEAFYNCRQLKELSTMQKIHAQNKAFAGCINLVCINEYQGMSFASIGKEALSHTPNLKTISVCTGGSLKNNALAKASVEKIIFYGNADISVDTLNDICERQIAIWATDESDLLQLAYNGYNVSILPF